VLEQFTTLTKKSISAYINELISDRLKLALKSNEEEQRQAQTEEKKIQYNGINTKNYFVNLKPTKSIPLQVQLNCVL
jgi:hypothetical protein